MRGARFEGRGSRCEGQETGGEGSRTHIRRLLEHGGDTAVGRAQMRAEVEGKSGEREGKPRDERQCVNGGNPCCRTSNTWRGPATNDVVQIASHRKRWEGL